MNVIMQNIFVYRRFYCFYCKTKFANLIIKFSTSQSQPKILFHVDETGIKSLHMKYFMWFTERWNYSQPF